MMAVVSIIFDLSREHEVCPEAGDNFMCSTVFLRISTSFLTHDIEKQLIALSSGVAESSVCMGDTSVQMKA